MRPYGIPPMPDFFIDCMYLLPDVFLQFTAEAFEFPRSDMPDTIRFIGPLLRGDRSSSTEPAWWNELDGSKPVVLVTQGTLANNDFSEVIQPALSGLADEKVTVIVAAGRSDTQTLTVPENARVASFIPFDRLMPKVDVLVTNGGYGAVNHAFSLGVPIVVAGETEDKDMVAARVGWTGAGSFKTRYAGAEQIRNAVRTILTNKQVSGCGAAAACEFCSIQRDGRAGRYCGRDTYGRQKYADAACNVRLRISRAAPERSAASHPYQFGLRS